MALQCLVDVQLTCPSLPVQMKRLKVSCSCFCKYELLSCKDCNSRRHVLSCLSNALKLFERGASLRGGSLKHFGSVGARGEKKDDVYSDSEDEDDAGGFSAENDPYLMTPGERQEWRKKIREVISMNPNVEKEVDPVERRKKVQKLLANYPLVMDDDDPEWPDDGDGWGFSLGQLFDKITIKNLKKEDDEDYDSENEIVWKDDNYICPIKDIRIADWEEAVFKDISPLIVLVHNRYKRPKENERVRDELERSVHIIWNCQLPSPRCVAVDAVVEHELVAALNVSIFPEIIFTKAGKVLYREKGFRTADELSKIMAFFYYGAAKPSFLDGIQIDNEVIPSVPVNSSFP